MARWVLIVGPKRSNKTGVAIELAERLRRHDVSCGGFVQVKRLDPSSETRYEIMVLRTGERIPIASEATAVRAGDGELFCSLRFYQAGFDQARRQLQENEADATAMFIGEVSKLEISEGGHFQVLTWALGLDDTKVVIMCARADQLFYIVEKFNLDEEDGLAWIELPVGDSEGEVFFESVIQGIRTMSRMLRGEDRE